MTPQCWRLIPLYEGTGTEQMAIDSWLLDQHAEGLQPPSLRFYTWRSPAISLGYHQRQFPAHWQQLTYRGQPVELVRRPTGGRAVLHQGDLTYALVTSGLQGSRRQVYEQLCQFLIEGWYRLGVDLSFGSAGRGYIKNPNCFGTATAADLVTVGGYKLIGSAQVYRKGCVLQHGSIRLQPDSELFERVFGEPMVQPELPKALQRGSSLAVLVRALTQAARHCLDVRFEASSLTRLEMGTAVNAYRQRFEQLSVRN